MLQQTQVQAVDITPSEFPLTIPAMLQVVPSTSSGSCGIDSVLKIVIILNINLP